MAKKKSPRKNTVKKKTVKERVSKKTIKKSPTKKKKVTKENLKKTQTTKTPASQKHSRKRGPLAKKKKRILINLIGFLIVLAISIVLYSVSGNYLSEVLFLTIIILSLVVCIALFLALISVLLAKKSRKKN